MSWTLVLFALLALWLVALVAALVRLLVVICHRRPCKPRDSSMDWTRRGGCLRIPDDVYRRPDPCIYSQYYLMSQGFAVTWNNPDIWLERNGVAESSASLQPDTEYDVMARVWNNSTEVPAVNLPVHFFYLDFGIGNPVNPVGMTKIDVPVKGAPGHPAFATVKWRTPATPGHYCLVARLSWKDDANPANNLGQENTDVKALNSPHAAFAFPVRNEAGLARTLRLQPDFYQPPQPRPCPDRPAPRPALTPDEIVALRREALVRHGRERFAVPQDWRVEIQPRELRLEPGEVRQVTVDVTAPDGFTGRQAINVNAFDVDRLVGGVTLYVE